MSKQIKEYSIMNKTYVLFESTDKREKDFLGNYYITHEKEKIFRGKLNSINDAEKSLITDLKNHLNSILSEFKQFNNLKINLEELTK